jgi:hypothetical protein
VRGCMKGPDCCLFVLLCTESLSESLLVLRLIVAQMKKLLCMMFTLQSGGCTCDRLRPRQNAVKLSLICITCRCGRTGILHSQAHISKDQATNEVLCYRQSHQQTDLCIKLLHLACEDAFSPRADIHPLVHWMDVPLSQL